MTCNSEDRAEELLHQVATEGRLCSAWEELKTYIVQVLKSVHMKYTEKETVEADSTKLYTELETMVKDCQRAPFTVQRICELLLNPTYNSFEKFCQAFEKLFHVVSRVAEGEGVFTSNLLYLRKQRNSDWQAADGESSCSSTETEILSDAENSNTALSCEQQDNNMNGGEEDSTEA
ncbi:hypothetical protein Gasu2_10760 [Galdieria sulphuraria]|uniref:Serine/threonine-protein phosphatase 4 regulatory subunit 2 n=1 Tax=Galdieria sulphuraria TaxID=130081 RepID=M2Y8C3_GALSU|nr:uncharacterized protein Gasu_08320 [Galdieria sulphuraria]EME32089.1 hypothetical protein Gasu_08320 [Galdieria sulphuraria]GJD06674.1 hypothetical protein Gasu2_10760 [Galdieria sulphuraria]|eukprot:XP_005708609.1 hypothetical protein Gasu_08320 [Galdieria sulphuraria]